MPLTSSIALHSGDLLIMSSSSLKPADARRARLVSSTCALPGTNRTANTYKEQNDAKTANMRKFFNTYRYRGPLQDTVLPIERFCSAPHIVDGSGLRQQAEPDGRVYHSAYGIYIPLFFLHPLDKNVIHGQLLGLEDRETHTSKSDVSSTTGAFL